MIPKIINAEFELNEMQWTTRTTTTTTTITATTTRNEESEIDGMDCFGLDRIRLVWMEMVCFDEDYE